MDIYIKALCGALAGVMICIVLSKSAKDYSVLAMLILCAILCMAIATFMKPILSLAETFGQMIDGGNIWLPILLKSVGLGFIGETVSALCADAGFGSIGKTLQLLTTVMILWVSLPLMEALMELIQRILELL